MTLLWIQQPISLAPSMYHYAQSIQRLNRFWTEARRHSNKCGQVQIDITCPRQVELPSASLVQGLGCWTCRQERMDFLVLCFDGETWPGWFEVRKWFLLRSSSDRPLTLAAWRTCELHCWGRRISDPKKKRGWWLMTFGVESYKPFQHHVC